MGHTPHAMYTAFLLALLALGVMLNVHPAPHRAINYVARTPTTSVPFEGPWAANRRLVDGCVKAGVGFMKGPETAVISLNGSTVYTGDVDGFIRSLDLRSGVEQASFFVGGRPLGLVAVRSADGTEAIVIADVVKGLLSLDPATRRLEVLTASYEGRALVYTDDVDVGKSGKLYFSDASTIAPWRRADGTHETFGASVLEFMEGVGTGRVFEYNPATRTTRLLASGLLFSNGVAVSEAEDYLLVCETYTARIMKIWLTGPRAGSIEVLVELPGYPDGMARGKDGSFWIAIASPRVFAERLHPYPLIKRLVSMLPEALKPKAIPYGMVAQIRGSDGMVLQTLHDPTGQAVKLVTGVNELADGRLLLGHLHEDFIHVCKV
eukprot:c2001_g1_i1.p1 GENE.c2001_g1_i1~~c2001_g1_i1.p1  ORF type:complete len:378 (+),score=57.29 c2001_g1_i1:14-1147(+)